MISSTSNFSLALSTLFFVLLFNQSFAQTEEVLPSLEANNDIVDISIELLPLHQLIDSAKLNSPLLHQQAFLIERRQLMIRQQKNIWLKSIKLNSSYTYGNNYSIIDGTMGEISTNIASNRYGLGVSISLPLYDIFSRKNTIKMADIDYKIEKEELIEIEMFIEQTITEMYYNIQLKGKILSIRNDALVVSNINFNYTELEFQNNTIDISVYSKVLEVKVKAQVALENAKTDYLISLMNLEVAVGINLRPEL